MLSNSTAHREVRRARQLRTMGTTAAALAHGSISTDYVDLLGRANQPWRDACFADHEDALVGHCQNLRFADARRLVRYWCQHADADAAESDGKERAEQATFSAATTFDGMVHLAGVLDPLGGAIFLESLHRLEHEQYLADKNSGRTRTAGQRRAAALVEMAIRAQAAPATGVRPRPLVTILVGDESFARVCELAEGVVIAPGQVVPVLADADIERIIFDCPSRVIDVSEKRAFTGALRRAIQVRDRHCQHPSGCDVPAAHCDVDHIQPYREGGSTSLDTGRLQCPTHNRDATLHDRSPLPPAPHPGDGVGDDRNVNHTDTGPTYERPPPEHT